MTMILVIEDDTPVRNLLTTALATHDFQYAAAKNGAEGLRLALSTQPDVILLDLGLPDLHGVELIHTVRGWTMNPIIVVSAHNDVADKIEALDAGADDYLTKPFSVDELLARIKVALRKKNYDGSGAAYETKFVNGNLTIDYAANLVTINGEEAHLTPIEYRLLVLLAKNVGKVLTHNFILSEIWQNADKGDTRSLRVYMVNLRRKIEPDPAHPVYLQTHVGIGYRLMRVPAEE